MKKALQTLLFVSIIAILVFVGGLALPKYASRLIGFGILLAIDFLFYSRYLAVLQVKNRNAKALIKYAFWIPLLFFAIYILATLIWPVHEWIPFFKIYFSGLLVPLFLWKIILLLFFLFSEILCLPVNFYKISTWIIRRKKVKWTQLKVINQLGVFFSLFVPSLLILGYFIWVYDFEVKKINLQFSELPQAFDGYKVVQISDLHLGSWLSSNTLERAVAEINSLKPDMVVFTGDMVNYSTSEVAPFINALSKVTAPDGVFSILGNHDYGDYAQWETPEDKKQNDILLKEFYREIGWKLLENEHAVIKRNTDSIAIIGVENWSANKLWGRRGDLSKASNGILNIPFLILLSHDPTHWRSEVLPNFKQVDITLSGHTHAMQFGIETKHIRWSPSKWLFPEWAGLYKSSNDKEVPSYLYVNRGLGHLGFPGRVGIRPEITLITFSTKI